MTGLFWGNSETGVWLAKSSKWRVLFFGHDALYIAAGRLRLRIMKPVLPKRPCPYCQNPDRSTVYLNLNTCQHPYIPSGGDPPCICDAEGTLRTQKL